MAAGIGRRGIRRTLGRRLVCGISIRSALLVKALRWCFAAALLAIPSQAFNAISESLSPVNGLPRFALVIGNARYAEAPLKNPDNDAAAIAEQLRHMGFTVTLKLDATRKEMLETIQAFGGNLAKQKGVGLFYFAGHGAQLSWHNYLIPVDAQIEQVSDMQTQAVDLSLLLDDLTRASNPMNIIILDACRDNPFGRNVRVEQKGLSQIDAPPGTLLAYATSPGNVAADGSGSNGLYTEYLLKEMQTRAAKIEDIFKRVRLYVRRESGGQQIPWESTSLEDDFYLIPPAQIKKLTPEEEEQQFELELAIWEKIKNSKESTPLEDYLRRYPSGKFSELAQFRLDRLLAQREKTVPVAAVASAPLATGPSSTTQNPPEPNSATVEADRKRQVELARAEAELKKQQELAKTEAARKQQEETSSTEAERKRQEALAQAEAERKRQEELARAKPTTPAPSAPIYVASIAPNPFSRGTGKADANYHLGDSYSYRTIDTLTKLETQKYTLRVTGVTDSEVIYNEGRIVKDLLGNLIKGSNGNQITDQQFFIPEYSIGKKWTTRYRFAKQTGENRDVVVDFKVVAREMITVPAGTFDAFKVEGTGFNMEQGAYLQYTYWIAPDKVRQPIIFISIERHGTGGLGGGGTKHGEGSGRHGGSAYRVTNRDELVAYQQSN